MVGSYSYHPKEFISKRYYQSLTVEGFDEIKGLEKAIVAYIDSSFVWKDGIVFEHSSPYSELNQLVFEYLKIHQPRKIRNFVEMGK